LGTFERNGGLGLLSTSQRNLHIGYFSISASQPEQKAEVLTSLRSRRAEMLTSL
jgi:hypothetical protein